MLSLAAFGDSKASYTTHTPPALCQNQNDPHTAALRRCHTFGKVNYAAALLFTTFLILYTVLASCLNWLSTIWFVFVSGAELGDRPTAQIRRKRVGGSNVLQRAKQDDLLASRITAQNQQLHMNALSQWHSATNGTFRVASQLRQNVMYVRFRFCLQYCALVVMFDFLPPSSFIEMCCYFLSTLTECKLNWTWLKRKSSWSGNRSWDYCYKKKTNDSKWSWHAWGWRLFPTHSNSGTLKATRLSNLAQVGSRRSSCFILWWVTSIHEVERISEMLMSCLQMQRCSDAVDKLTQFLTTNCGVVVHINYYVR